MHSSRLPVLCGALTLASLTAFAQPAAAGTLTFDAISPSCNASVGSYGGLTFSAFTTECDADYMGVLGFNNSYGATSPDFAAFNDFGAGEAHVSIGAGSFSLVQGSFSSFAYANAFESFSSQSLAVAGYRAGDAVDAPTYYTTFDLDPTAYVLQTFTDPSTLGAWTGLVDLAFFSGAATAADNVFAVDGLSWLMDDLKVDVSDGATPVPEPGTLSLLALGLAGAARARARRNRQRLGA